MYTRQEASQVRSKFWTTFGQYLRPVRGAEGETVNWLNYKTGIKDLYFRMDVTQKHTSIAVEFRQQFADDRYRLYDSWFAMRQVMEQEVSGNWTWERDFRDEDGRMISRIIDVSDPLNLFDEKDWPAIISFLKPRIIALDAFWQMVKDRMP